MTWKKEFLKVDSMVVSWWIVAFLPSAYETIITCLIYYTDKNCMILNVCI